jgi:1,4-dihydroxy-2-naphthoate octaprenyltransferase
VDQVEQDIPASNAYAAYTEFPLRTEVASSRVLRSSRSSNTLVAWVRLCRPPTLVLGLAPVLITLSLLWVAGQQLLVFPIVCVLLSVALVMAGAGMLDEYLEFERTVHRRWNYNNGGSYYAENVLEGSGIYPLTVLRASVTLLGLGVFVGLPLVATGGIALVMLGGLGLVTAVLYSSTNFALKRLPAGELMILLTLGPGLSVATALSQGHMPSLQVLEVGLALGLFTLALVLAAHLRDQEADRSMSRRTLVQVNGQRGSIVLYTTCLIAAYLLIVLVALPNEASHGALLVALSLPAALLAWSGVTRALSHTARQLAVRHMLRAYIYFSLWILVGLVVGGVIVQVVARIQGHL